MSFAVIVPRFTFGQSEERCKVGDPRCFGCFGENVVKVFDMKLWRQRVLLNRRKIVVN